MQIDVHGTIGRGAFTTTIDLTVASGSTVIVRGANGAGKTTLLRTIAGLDALVDGEVRLGGRLVDHRHDDVFVPAHERSIAMAFQEPRLFEHLDVLANVVFGLRADGMDRAQAEHRGHEALARTGTADLAGRRPRELSGGQAQRVGLARALALDRPVLLVDEPLAAVEDRVRGELRRVIAEQAATTVWVSHADAASLPRVDATVTL